MVTTRRKTVEISKEDVVQTRNVKPGAASWTHTPTNFTLVWLFVSLPLVIWDTGYMLSRPHSFAGNAFHWPWKPYALYATIDYVYGLRAWDTKLGFSAAQSWMNIVETAFYMFYLWLLFAKGVKQGDRKMSLKGRSFAPTLASPHAGPAALLLFATTTMTLAKTVLYWLHEHCTGYANVGHNPLSDLVLLWIIPNGLWIVVPIYMLIVLTPEILQGLEASSE